MSHFTRALGAALSVVILGSIIALIPQKTALGQNGNTQPVIVKNTPLPTTVTNTPLPVSGAVNVNNFPPSQNVNVTNSPLPVSVSGNVNVGNFPPTQNVSGTVVNTSVNPVPILDVNTSAEEPFQTLLCTNAGSFSGVSCPEPVQFTVPSMTTDNLPVKRLVIENVSGICSVGPTSVVQAMAVSTRPVNENTVNNVSEADALIAVLPGVFPAGPAFNGTTRLYADPGATVGLLSYAGPDFLCTAFVNGHLITK